MSKNAEGRVGRPVSKWVHFLLYHGFTQLRGLPPEIILTASSPACLCNVATVAPEYQPA